MNDVPRQRFRFGLKSLLVAMTLAGIVLATLTYPIIEARQQQALMNRVVVLGGRVSNLSVVVRPMSPGRFVLSLFSSKFDRYYFYGFDFSGTALADDDLKWVARIEQVKELNLSGTKITGAGLEHLRDLKYLTKIDLTNTRVTDKAVQDLKTLEILASLNVKGTAVTYAALADLDSQLKYAHFSEERAIDELKGAGIQVVDLPRTIEGDSARGCWIVYAGREVHEVVVGMNRPITLTNHDVENLAHLTSLGNMTLHTVTIGPEGLTGLKSLPNLKDLEIWFVNLTDRDLQVMAQQTQLDRLTIYGCDQVIDKGIERLKTLKNLKRLRVYGKGITQNGVAQLKAALPDCEVSGAS